MDKTPTHHNAVMGQLMGQNKGSVKTMGTDEQSAQFGSALSSGGHMQAFELLKAVPFTLNVDDRLSFSLPSLAMQLLCCEAINLPNNDAQWSARMNPEDALKRRKAIKRLSWNGARYALRYPIHTEKGETLWVSESGERVLGDKETPKQILGVIRNVDAEQKRIKTAQYHATYDELSGLFNQTAFTRSLRIINAWARRKNEAAAVLRLRVNNIDDINSVYGYEVGDRVLAQIGQRLKEIVRAPDIISRLEGVDFGICLIDMNKDDITALLPRLEAALSETPYVTPHGGLYAEFAMSATFLGRDAHNAEQAIWQTQTVFTARPNLQGWEVGYFEADMTEAASPPVRAETTETDILTALNERRISLAYQPIIDAKTRDLHHYECLLRLRREDGEVISAGSFIMAAERLGLVNLLDRRALEIAAIALVEDLDLHIALNVSAGTLRNQEAASDYLNALKALGPNAARVTIELTETLALDDPAMASLFSIELRKLGCAFAIDDFGSGYTTFRNLMAIEADTIKIDGSFIQGIATEPHKQTFVRMMVDLAQTFSVKTVAEMVDCRADADLLRRLGVDYLQGYMFGIPAAAPTWQRQAS